MAASGVRHAFIRRDVLANILILAWPAVLEQVLIMMGGFIVTILLGQYGTNELAAAGLIGMIVAMLQTSFAGLATGATILVARMKGMGDDYAARNTLFQSLAMGLAISCLVGLAGVLAAQPILRLFFQNIGDAGGLAVVYFRYALYSLPFLTVDMTIAAALRGAGDTFTPMAVTGLGSASNIVLCALLIHPLGMAGAGIALLSSRVFTALLRLSLIFRRGGKLFLSLREGYRLDLSLMKRILRQGLPAFLEQAIMQGGFLMNSTVLASLGSIILATWQVGVNINSLAYMPIFGLAVAAMTCIGQALGSQRVDDAADYSRDTMRLGIAVISLIGILTAVFAGPLAHMFSKDPEVVRNSIILIRFFAVIEPLLAVLNVGSSTLRAGGDTVYVMLTALVGLWVFRVGLSVLLVFAFQMGLYGIMIGTACDFLARSILYLVRIRKGKWKYRRV